MPDDKDPREPTQRPVKRRGGRPRPPQRPPTGQSSPPRMENVTPLFGEVGSEPARSGVEIPPSGRKGTGPDGDRRRRQKVRPTEINLGKRWTEIFESVKAGEYTWDEFVATLTPQELARGQLMDKDGTFRGRPPTMVPRAFLNACTKELMARGARLWKENYVDAIEVMTSIAKDENVKASDRIKAAEFVIERLEGKVPQTINVSVEEPWQVALEGMVAEVQEEMAISRAHDYSVREAAVLAMEDETR